MREAKVLNKYNLTLKTARKLEVAMNQKSVNLCFGETM